MQTNATITLLHLSDLHFGRHHRFASGNGPETLLDRLRIDLDELRDQKGLRPDLVVVSGDLAEFGDSDEFQQAMTFLWQVAQTIELPPQNFVIVPGNHDINWDLSRSYFAECKAYKKPAQRPYYKKFAFFEDAFTRFYDKCNGISFSAEEPWSFFEYPELNMVVAGMNSVIAESHKDEDHFGFLGETQLRSFAEKLRLYKERGFFRLGVMHHPPRDRRGGEETRKDQALFMQLLAPSLNLLLHGDAHEDTGEALHVNVPVLGLGSSGVAVGQRPEEVPNQYQMLRISANGIQRWLRDYAPDKRRFLHSARAEVNISVQFQQIEAFGKTSAPRPATDLETFVEQYRRSIIKNQRMHTVSDLLGRDPLDGPMTAFDFLKLFIPPDVMGEEPMLRFRDEQTRGNVDQFDALGIGGYSDTAAGVLSRGWVYLLGAPGAGKTALTRWILLSLCVPGERLEGFSENLVPIRIDMRLFHDAYEKAAPGFSFFDYLDSVHRERSWNLRGEALRELARLGRVYFLFDGLDEVIDESKRKIYAEMIAGLACSDEYSKCRGVVTSRVVGAELTRSIFNGARFSTYTLRDFTEKQQDRFLEAWHALVFADEPELREHRHRRITRALTASLSLRALCGNPLCCSLLAYLNRDEELPEGRHGLYQKILERWAEHWDANKGLPRPIASVRFDLFDKLSFLRRLAWSMMEGGGAEAGNAIGRDKLVAFAQSFCEEQWSESPDTARRLAEALISSLRERNEVLAWLGPDLYGFSHRALLEYSAAARAVELHGHRSGVSELANWFRKHWREDGWEETLLLTCGLLREKDHGPALVVQVLQEMAGNDRARVYRELDDYLCFYIKALGELRSLEHGLPRDFAERINGVLEYRIVRDPPMDEQKFLDAFRRCSEKWPDVERLLRATEKSFDSSEKDFPQNLSHVWIAAAGRNGRLHALLEGLRVRSDKLGHERSEASLLCQEAARFGPWSADEETRLHNTAADEPYDGNRYHLLRCITHAPGISFHPDEPVIQALVQLMNSSYEMQWRRRAAYTLIKRGVHVDDALACLRGYLKDADSTNAAWSAHALRLRGYADDETISVLCKFALSHPWCLADLISLSRTNPAARRALDEVSYRMELNRDVRTTFAAFAIGISKSCVLIDADEMRKRMRASDVKLAISLLEQHSDISRLEPFIAEEYARWLSMTKGQPTWTSVVQSAFHVSKKKGAKPFHNIWAELLECNDVRFAAGAAFYILEFSENVRLREAARAKMLDYLRGNRLDEENLLQCAQVLGADEPDADAAIKSLAKSADLIRIRFMAAEYLGDLASIDDLTTQDDHNGVREVAREVQDLYSHIHDLLYVGRPRRAIVKLYDERVGVLRETTFQGGTEFVYDSAYCQKPDAKPIAPNLRLRAEPYTHPDKLHAFFANLLPEGAMLEQKARKLGLPSTDRFGILLHVGEDVMGAVQVLPEEAF